MLLALNFALGVALPLNPRLRPRQHLRLSLLLLLSRPGHTNRRHHLLAQFLWAAFATADFGSAS